MWSYNKLLQYPINIKCTDPRLAKVIISQYGGPDGELAKASLRYLSQGLECLIKKLRQF